MEGAVARPQQEPDADLLASPARLDPGESAAGLRHVLDADMRRHPRGFAEEAVGPDGDGGDDRSPVPRLDRIEQDHGAAMRQHVGDVIAGRAHMPSPRPRTTLTL